MLLGLPEALPSLVEARFKAAKASRALIFSPTELAIVRTSAGVPFQLRYCPALAKKPEPRRDEAPKKKFDPFDNPPPDLHVADIPATNPSHLLVLNKFPIIPNHFILATKADKPQTHALEADDLESAYASLKAWQDESSGNRTGRLFAFFNSGEHSGASQPHRHLQFLPVDSIHDGEKSAGWHLLIDSILSRPNSSETQENTSRVIEHPSLPFMHFAYRFPPEVSSSGLLRTYHELFRLAKEAVDNFIAAYPGQLSLHSIGDGDLPISYNLAMTTAGMAIIPRRSEGHSLRRHDGTEAGFVQLNGTVLAGTLMVKSQEDYEMLQKHPEKIDLILEAIGIPRTGNRPN